MNAVLPHLLTTLDVSLWLSLPASRVERMARTGTIPCIMLPTGGIVFDADELRHWFDELRGKRGALCAL
jgi:hypothetical protein